MLKLRGRGPNRMTADHKNPLSRGGYDKRKNVVACCLRCNQEKRSKSYSEWMAIRAENIDDMGMKASRRPFSASSAVVSVVPE